MCFQVDNKSPHAALCVKSKVLNKVIDSILSINKFNQQCVVIKRMLQSSRLEDHMMTIGIDQFSFTRSYFEQICMNNIKKIYQHADKSDDWNKSIITTHCCSNVLVDRMESMTLFNTLDLTHWAAWGDLLSTWKHKYSLCCSMCQIKGIK